MDKSPRRADYDVRNLGNFCSLFHHVHSADDHWDPQVQSLTGENEELVSDLEGELSRWGDDETEDSKRVLRKFLKDGHGKTGGFSRACVCTPNNMLSLVLQRMSESRLLDKRWLLNPNSSKIFHEPAAHSKLWKRLSSKLDVGVEGIKIYLFFITARLATLLSAFLWFYRRFPLRRFILWGAFIRVLSLRFGLVGDFFILKLAFFHQLS